MNPLRIRKLNDFRSVTGRPVIYWMSRDQRVNDNWALIFSQELAEELSSPLAVVFCLTPIFLNATLRQYSFMLKGLQEVESNLAKLDMPFFLLTGFPQNELPSFIRAHKVGALVADFDPLRIKREWRNGVVNQIAIPAYEVDAHNIVPCWSASPKQEYGAHTFRPKIHRVLPEFLDEFPKLKRHRIKWNGEIPTVDWAKAEKSLQADRNVTAVDWIQSGEKGANRHLNRFINDKLQHYAARRNDPTQDGQSNLSPCLHFGQISAQRVVLEVGKSGIDAPEFLEELIVRRELSDNFCYYNQAYDSTDGFPDWARRTLDEHRSDPRLEVYTFDKLEHSQTYDRLWNASQREMVIRGKMHGYMRMYWAKKILEWSPSPEEALKRCIYLNDHYELDGRDPSGYTGIAWSIGGVHDRAWASRPIFGKVRYMSYDGCARKFDVNRYIQQVNEL